jgi:hypothetical protein
VRSATSVRKCPAPAVPFERKVWGVCIRIEGFAFGLWVVGLRVEGVWWLSRLEGLELKV